MVNPNERRKPQSKLVGTWNLGLKWYRKQFPFHVDIKVVSCHGCLLAKASCLRRPIGFGKTREQRGKPSYSSVYVMTAAQLHWFFKVSFSHMMKMVRAWLVVMLLLSFMKEGCGSSLQGRWAKPKGDDEKWEKLGSRPPSCENRCGGCNPCGAVQVPTTAGRGDRLRAEYANYEPEGWKCKCGALFFNP
ncbi:hypothetical protein HPP92_003592 [Vanilla planifolia]|uniref:Epidermal patterning factor-like protein n=1 Tax=Vanilla planifolia TaxID=51239 RepID=A0A835SAN8_VANPL|nr:hypothetical protein HPP92_003592 [Vanilla planifolia]